MKQMITRLDDELHVRVKEQAVAEGRSVNELVLPDPPAETPSWRDVEVISREFGTAVSEALEVERSAR